MATPNSWDSSFVIDPKVTQKGTKHYQKARLPLTQRLSFSVGNFLNDAVAGAWTTYLIIFQTKVLGMSNRGVGLLSIVSFSVDAVLSLFVGYVCDNRKFPLCAKRYGKRKSFHLLGTILVAGFFPLLMMPCFICGDDSSEWKMLIYYGFIMIIHNFGWALAQVTHLALIPECAKRPREMVELHSLRSGITFVSGIFTYAVTLILLNTDDRDESISAGHWKDFLEMSFIVVSAGCLFSLIFHLGTKEPIAGVQIRKDKFISGERHRNPTAELPEKVVGVFCLYDEKDLNVALPVGSNSQLPDLHLDITGKEFTEDDIVVGNTGFDESCGDSFIKCTDDLHFTDQKKQASSYEFSFSNPGFKTSDELVRDSEKKNPEQDTSEHSNSEKFSFSNLTFVNEDKQGAQHDQAQPQKTSGKFDDARNDISIEERLDLDVSEGYASSPETDSVGSNDIQQDKDTNKEPSCQTVLGHLSPQPSRRTSFPEEIGKSFVGVDVIINKINKQGNERRKTSKSWIDWFKNPMFYKISFAYMCTRVIQGYSLSYVPMYLMDTLEFEKESIAYFPLVILASGVFSSLGAKKLDKILGAKWTYCLAASSVIGSSVWFYVQTISHRNAAYCAAILLGFGGSVMYVTSTALAGELIGESKDSGAFVFASMGSLGKVACGGAFFFTQEFFPTQGASPEYVRFVFSGVLGAASILGFLAVIAFLPATVRCKKVVHSVDAAVQTEETVISDIINDNRVVLCNECQSKELVIDMRTSNARLTN
ncbi:major facilitator superfamily domain-containing protein 12-like [Montipora capricornis]|uniref:major facilitator superfamily domain-containing protein 12-like n=1 Tax=Montipora capricornis TaxID=246305 RepID=UPI0035F19CEF